MSYSDHVSHGHESGTYKGIQTFFSTRKKLRLFRSAEDLTANMLAFPGKSIILTYHKCWHCLNPAQSEIPGRNAARWLDSGGPSRLSGELQEKESPSSFKREKSSKCMSNSSPGLPGTSFPSFTPFHRLLLSVGTPKILPLLPSLENT